MSEPGIVTPQPEPVVEEGWGEASPDKTVELPSGHSAVVRRLEIIQLVELDILDKLDGFSGKALQEPGKKGKKGKPGGMAEQAEGLKSMMEVLDKVVVAATISPVVHPKLEEGEEQIKGRAYVNLIGIGDKMAIFNVAVEGMQEFFRLSGEQTANVGALEEKQGLGEVSE